MSDTCPIDEQTAALLALCPSRLADLAITRRRHDWELQVRDIWGHMHSPFFQGPHLTPILAAASDYIRVFVAKQGEDPRPWLDDDGKVMDANPSRYPEASTGRIVVA